MKKIFMMFVIVGLTTSGLYAQVSGGVRAGMNLSNVKVSYDGVSRTFDRKIGFLAGGYLTANLGDKFAIQPELVYSLMGGSEDDVNYNLGFIAIPVYLRYNITEKFNIHVGPQASFLTSAKIKADGETYDWEDDAFKSVEFGASFGIGIDLGKFNGGVRYYAGLSNILGEAYPDYPGAEFKNSGFQFFVGFKLFGK